MTEGSNRLIKIAFCQLLHHPHPHVFATYCSFLAAAQQIQVLQGCRLFFDKVNWPNQYRTQLISSLTDAQKLQGIIISKIERARPFEYINVRFDQHQGKTLSHFTVQYSLGCCVSSSLSCGGILVSCHGEGGHHDGSEINALFYFLPYYALRHSIQAAFRIAAISHTILQELISCPKKLQIEQKN